jgi:hypothetical protein
MAVICGADDFVGIERLCASLLDLSKPCRVVVALQLQAGDALGKGRAFRLQHSEQIWKRNQLRLELDALHVA